ncbi:MAG TPA: hypothetical protein VMM38_16160 [Aridibacter sp.]|nr:hypothetical protein [Aridibacter sp.]
MAPAKRIIVVMIKTRSLLAAAFLIAAFSAASEAQWKMLDAGTDASFRGLDVVSEKVVWASGTGGTVVRSTDRGKSWKVFKVPGAEKLDFRDIEAFDEKTAYVLSIGNGASSRIYKTSDGGVTWKLQFTNEIEEAFFDSIAFWDEKNGIAQSDPVAGKYVLYITEDGENWKRLPESRAPSAKEGEAAFAASGTCVITEGKHGLFLITGGTDARVLYSPDRGKTWASSSAPMVHGESGTGIFGIAIRGKHGVIVGGDYTKPELDSGNIAYSSDGGKTWKIKLKANPFGYRSGVTFVTDEMIIVVGSGGSDISLDGGESWRNIDDGNWNAVGSKGKKAVYAVGPGGRIGKYEFGDR